MEPKSVHKTFKYKLNPTPAQEQALETVVSRCRMLDNVALEQRKTWWVRGQGMSATCYQQKAELPDLKDGSPDYAEINAQVLQDVILRVERAFHAFFRRVQAGEEPGYPRFQGTGRYNGFTYPHYGGAVVDGRLLSLSNIGRIWVRMHRPIEGSPKTVTISREADGWYACTLHQPGLLGLWGARGEKPVGAHPCLSALRAGAGPRPERGVEHAAGPSGPSGANVAGCGERRLRSPAIGVGKHVT